MKIKVILFVFSLFLTYCTACASPVRCPVTTEFKAFSMDLDKARVNSVLKLSDFFRTSVNGQSEQCSEELFFQFRQFYYDSLKLQTLPDPILDINAVNSELSRVGWRVRQGEGEDYVAEDGKWLRSEFGEFLSRPWNEYLRQREIEIRERFSDDAALLISWETLRHRISFWENFLNENPNFPIKDEISEYLEIYIATFLTGVDNSRIENDDSTLKKDVKLSFEKFINENMNSKYHAIVVGYYDVLKRNNFRVTQDAARFLESRQIETMLGVQPPDF